LASDDAARRPWEIRHRRECVIINFRDLQPGAGFESPLSAFF
jgi:hypothetical protein